MNRIRHFFKFAFISGTIWVSCVWMKNYIYSFIFLLSVLCLHLKHICLPLRMEVTGNFSWKTVYMLDWLESRLIPWNDLCFQSRYPTSLLLTASGACNSFLLLSHVFIVIYTKRLVKVQQRRKLHQFWFKMHREDFTLPGSHLMQMQKHKKLVDMFVLLAKYDLTRREIKSAQENVHLDSFCVHVATFTCIHSQNADTLSSW